MERYSIQSKLVVEALVAVLLILLTLTAMDCSYAADEDIASQDQCLNNDHFSNDFSTNKHSITFANPASSDEDILDYNDVYKVYKLFSFSGIHNANHSMDTVLALCSFETFHNYSNNLSSREKTIRLRTILI